MVSQFFSVTGRSLRAALNQQSGFINQHFLRVNSSGSNRLCAHHNEGMTSLSHCYWSLYINKHEEARGKSFNLNCFTLRSQFSALCFFLFHCWSFIPDQSRSWPVLTKFDSFYWTQLESSSCSILSAQWRKICDTLLSHWHSSTFLSILYRDVVHVSWTVAMTTSYIGSTLFARERSGPTSYHNIKVTGCWRVYETSSCQTSESCCSRRCFHINSLPSLHGSISNYEIYTGS